MTRRDERDPDAALPVPPDALASRGSLEVMRAWIGDGTLHCSLRPEIWPDPACWGMLLADLARYVAAAVEERLGIPAIHTLPLVRDAFASELERPPDREAQVS